MLFKCKQFDVQQSPDVFKITTDATLLGAIAWNDCDLIGTRILEVGSGTGIISLMLAQRFSEVSIHAIDKSSAATLLTELNFAESKYASRLSAKTKDVLDLEDKYDHIIINPPYFQDDTKSSKISEKGARHLENMNYQILIEKLLGLLNEEGSIELIHPVRYLQEIEHALTTNEAYLSRVIRIRHNEQAEPRNAVTRIVKSQCVTQSQFFNIRDSDSTFSIEYVALLRDFINV